MGARKQKWSEEEEYTLKAGVIKHGIGKWRTILKDPEFSSILYYRSNVDLKDKWRNMGQIANGWGSRESSGSASRTSQHSMRHDENMIGQSTFEEYDDEVYDAKPLSISEEPLQLTGPKTSFSKVDSLIIEAIKGLNESTGSNKTSIAMYIEERYESPPNFKELLSAKLKALTTSGKLIKVKHDYRIAPNPAFSKGKSSKSSLWQRVPGRAESRDVRPVKFHMDEELMRMQNMTEKEAAAVAARAVAEADAAMAIAEEAVREAENAEAEAQEARAFAEAALLTLKRRKAAKLMDRV